MRLEKACTEVIQNVAYRMRDVDFAELSALSHQETRLGLADELAMVYGQFDVWAVCNPDPVAIIGWLPIRPRTLGLLMFATDEFAESSGKAFSKFVRLTIWPIMMAEKPNRLEAQSLESHTDAHDWLEFIGLRRECVLQNWGKSGETFISYIWVPD